MVLMGETLATGASPRCGCGWVVVLKVCRSGGGYYIGAVCPNCGPYCRESGYYRTSEAAQAALDSGNYGR